MFAYWFLAVISTLAASSGTTQAAPPFTAIGATMINVLAWGLLAVAITYQSMCDGTRDPERAMKIADRFDLMLNRLLWCWLPINALCILQFGWGNLSVTLPGLKHSLLLKALWLGLPTGCVASVVWSVQYAWDRWLLQFSGLGARSHYFHHLWMTWRLQAGWLLAPTRLLYCDCGCNAVGLGECIRWPLDV